ncbi:MAG: type II toxin-antitoxin system HicA family toxin [Candidatus Methanoperedens sp.]|nr:type II toxin-antitoxin system HicA family toxin [Candidatus Methanoperedens sp.]
MAALKKAGFVEVRQKGSHISLQKITYEIAYKKYKTKH